MGCSSCGGGLAAPAQQMRLEGVRARGVAAATLVRIRYIGEDRRVRPYVAEGKVYFFGNTDRRREGIVPSRVAWQFLEKGGRFYGSFEVVESGDALSRGAADDVGAVAGAGAADVGVAHDAASSAGDAAGVTPRRGKKGGG